MGAANKNTSAAKDLLLPKEFHSFFAGNDLNSVRGYFLHLFKAWVNFPPEEKQHSDKEIALFLDQLINLVAAAHILHQENGALDGQEGGGHV